MAIERGETRDKHQTNREAPKKKDWQRPELTFLTVDETNAKTQIGDENLTTKPS